MDRDSTETKTRPTLYQSIGGWFQYEQVYLDAVEKAKDGDVFVELGTFQGRSACFMAEAIKLSGKNIRFYTVDNHDFYRSMTKDQQVHNGVNGGFEYTIEDVYRNLEPVKDYVTVVNGNSWDGVPGVEVCDFCWVDASHDYEDVKRDLLYWLPRSKVIGGDDYGFGGVANAVTQLCPDAKTCDWWILDPNPYYRGPL